MYHPLKNKYMRANEKLEIDEAEELSILKKMKQHENILTERIIFMNKKIVFRVAKNTINPYSDFCKRLLKRFYSLTIYTKKDLS